MKHLYAALLACLLAVFCLPLAQAADPEPEFLFSLSVDGSDTREAAAGDVLTVLLTLERTDQAADYTMHAMQTQITYDSRFFALVEDSLVLQPGIEARDLALRDQQRQLYLNYLSLTGGDLWPAKTVVGSFQLEVIGESGAAAIKNEACLVSRPDGSGSYPVRQQDVTVLLSRDCVITYETGGGSPLEPGTAVFGQLLEQPEPPTREGFDFAGWYRDFDLQLPWDFAADSVEGNLTLYAKWVPHVEAPVNYGPVLWLIPAAAAAVGLFFLHRGRKRGD